MSRFLLGLPVLFGLFFAINAQSIAIGHYNISTDLVQDTLVRGRVRDSIGQPIGGARISVIGKNINTISGNDGSFSLTRRPTVGDSVTVSALGYGIWKQVYNGESNLTIRLMTSVTSLNEVSVVSTGYSTLPKERATGSFVQIDNELLNRRVSPDLISRLEDVTSALYMDRRTGGEPRISVRGRSTIFANDQPLVVLDNFPYDGDLNNINPNDVESVTVLKDAAAASIWGVRAGNGVIVITTKKGNKNQPLKVDFNANTTIGQRPDVYYSPSFLNASDFMEVEQWLYGEGYYDSWLTDQNRKPLSPLVELMLATDDQNVIDQQVAEWQGYDIREDYHRYLLRPSVHQQYALNFRGGSEKSAYSLSTGYDNMVSNQVGNKSDRFTVNGNLQFSPVRNMEVSGNLIYTMTNGTTNGIGTDVDVGSGTLGIYPYARLADENGNHLAIEQNYRNGYKSEMEALGLLDWNYRPLDEINLRDITRTGHEIRLNTGLRYNLPFNFSTEVRYQYLRALGQGNSLYDAESYYARHLVNRYTSVSGATPIQNIPNGAIMNRSNNDGLSQTGRFQLNYDNEWANGRHDIHALAGFEVREYINKTNGANTVYGYDPNVLTSRPVNFNQQYATLPANNTALIPSGLSIGETLDRFRSYFANASYTYLDKYIISGSARVDQSNYFGVRTNQKSVPLWSAGLAWNLHQEKFINSDLFPLMKLRATYGYNGNLDRTVTAFTTAFYLFDSYNSAQRAIISNPPNPELRWERIAMTNIGLDLGIGNLFSGSVDFYTKTGKDMIGFSPLDPTTGVYNSATNSYGYKGNFAQTKSNGIDLEIRNNPKRIWKDLFWHTNLLFNYTYDKVTSYDMESTASSYLANGSGLLSDANTISPLKGKPVFGIYAYRWGGLNPEDGNPIGYINGELSQDYNAIISSTSINDLEFMGRALPSIFGTLGNTFQYGKLSLSINVTYKQGHYFRTGGISYSGLYSAWNGHEEYGQRWMTPGDESLTSVPSRPDPYLGNLANRDTYYLLSEVNVDKGDNIRLQDAQISYGLDGRSFPIRGVYKVHLYAYANNLGIIWKSNKGKLDPDYVQGYSYPPARTFAFGIKFTH